MKSIKTKLIAFATVFMTMSAANAWAQYSEYEVKAAYIFNFAKFIEWPANYIENDTLYLCVYKNDPFGIILEKTMIGRKANGKDWKIRRISSLAEIDNCHMLIIADTYARFLRDRIGKENVIFVSGTDCTPSSSAISRTAA